jgi:uncharacterized coiled-coil protein SlyX
MSMQYVTALKELRAEVEKLAAAMAALTARLAILEAQQPARKTLTLPSKG